MNGDNVDPLEVIWHFRHDGQETVGARTRFELAHFDGAGFSTGARGEGSCGITLFNQIGGDLFTQYNLVIEVNSATEPLYTDMINAGWLEAGGFLRYPSGVDKEAGVWHEMKIEVRETVINFYIDDVLRNPPSQAAGVPRPNDTAYDFLILGEGFSNNGPMMMFDNVAVLQGAAYPFGTPEISAPTVVEPAYPGSGIVSLTAVDPNAVDVTVYSNGSPIGSTDPGGLTDVDVAVAPALLNGTSITATQTIGVATSCESIPVTVGVPAPSIADAVLVPGQTTVTVTNVAAGAASTVTVYSNETTVIGTFSDPNEVTIDVTTSALANGATITASQTIQTVEGCAIGRHRCRRSRAVPLRTVDRW